jgi:glc operon protein GlcG
MIHQNRKFAVNAGLALAILASGVAMPRAAAQQSNLDKFVITGAAAKRAMSRSEISAETAEKIAKACEEYATANKVAVAIFILNPSGNIVHAHRMDGLGPINVETGLYKAQTALYVRRPTSIYERDYQTDAPSQIARVKLDKYYVAGGLPIVVDDVLIGAIGVGGNREHDEKCAWTALNKVIGPQPPLPPGPDMNFGKSNTKKQ